MDKLPPDPVDEALQQLLEQGLVAESPSRRGRRLGFRRVYDGTEMLGRRYLTLAADSETNGAEEKAARPREYNAGYFQGVADAFRIAETMLRRLQP